MNLVVKIASTCQRNWKAYTCVVMQRILWHSSNEKFVVCKFTPKFTIKTHVLLTLINSGYSRCFLLIFLPH